ncbi:hypothetical protein F5884DRAFT_202635 [Xylogone sp. PMI_703]|nr:hypothetical protein F5884DRAFT_202635 [Xylogone sp. PMI_703]
MAAVAGPHAQTALTPPSSSHGGQNSWDYSVPVLSDSPQQSKMESDDGDQSSIAPKANGKTSLDSLSRPDLSQRRADTSHSMRAGDHLAPARVAALGRKDSNISESGSAPDSLLDLYSKDRSGTSSAGPSEAKDYNADAYDEEDPESSRWIHRDKLARIENEELQAAGIILPRTRATSRSGKRDHNRDQKRPRVGSLPTEEQEISENAGWDLRTPEEAAEDANDPYRHLNGSIKGLSRIPVNKASPLPIPIDYLERDTPMIRKQTGTGDDESISSKPRGRSESVKALDDPIATPPPAKKTTEMSPSKKPATSRKSSANRGGTNQRPKTRSGSNNSASARPPTRSGDGPTSTNKRPEGDPPWLATMYKPDPRLPPDQQLLPTVAKRLQQEQWEKEGKFGNTYDREFRPLNDEPFQPPPEIMPQSAEQPTKEEHGAEWPLKDPKTAPLPSGRPGTSTGGTYSTMPKITGVPQGMSSPVPAQTTTIQRTQEPPQDSEKDGCGCCTIM